MNSSRERTVQSAAQLCLILLLILEVSGLIMDRACFQWTRLSGRLERIDRSIHSSSAGPIIVPVGASQQYPGLCEAATGTTPNTAAYDTDW